MSNPRLRIYISVAVRILTVACVNAISAQQALANPFTNGPPSPADVHNAQGAKLANSCRFHEAICEFTKALILDPKSATAYAQRAIAYSQLKQFKDALKDATKAVKLAPSDSVYRSNRAALALELGQPKNAIKDLFVAIEYDGRNPTMYENRALAYERLKQYELAQADFISAEVFYRKLGESTEAQRMHEMYARVTRKLEGRSSE